MYDLKILAKRLKATRIANNLTQRQLADKAKMTNATISAYEKELKNPSLENIAHLATALNVSMDWLCGNEVKTAVPKTYGDFIAKLIHLLGFVDYGVEDVDDWYDKNKKKPCTDIRFYDGVLEGFLYDLGKMKKLLDDKTIDENIFNSWLDGQIQKYSRIEIEG